MACHLSLSYRQRPCSSYVYGHAERSNKHASYCEGLERKSRLLPCELDTGAPSCGLQRLSSPLLPPLLPASHIKTALLVQFKTPLQEEETLLPFISEGNKKSD